MVITTRHVAVRRRVAIISLWWLLGGGLVEARFIAYFRVNGDGSADYGDAFAREKYMRETLGTGAPCSVVPGSGPPCTQQQVDAWHQTYTSLFWHDVIKYSFPFVIVFVVLFCAILVVTVQRAHKHRNDYI